MGDGVDFKNRWNRAEKGRGDKAVCGVKPFGGRGGEAKFLA